MKNLIAFIVMVLVIVVMGCSDESTTDPDIGVPAEMGTETAPDAAPLPDIVPGDASEGVASDVSQSDSGAQDAAGDPENVGHD
jgi:hypothetical protein